MYLANVKCGSVFNLIHLCVGREGEVWRVALGLGGLFSCGGVSV